MSQSWKIAVFAPREEVEKALLKHEDRVDWDTEIILSGREICESKPHDWVLEAWLARKPTSADKKAIAALFGENPPPLDEEMLPAADWVAISQQGVTPIQAGRFYVRTPDHEPPNHKPRSTTAIRDLVIPASRAFGTGQHETTAGCLIMLDAMKARGTIVRNMADIGTGTGLLAFAALDLWPRALTTLSDIDATCTEVVEENARINNVPTGPGPGEVTMVVADGMKDELLQARAPYDLVIANILAGPLISLAPDFARAILPGGQLLLSGLLEEQEQQVRAAYRRAGFRLAHRMTRGDWAILWMRRRPHAAILSTRPHALPRWARSW